MSLRLTPAQNHLHPSIHPSIHPFIHMQPQPHCQPHCQPPTHPVQHGKSSPHAPRIHHDNQSSVSVGVSVRQSAEYGDQSQRSSNMTRQAFLEGHACFNHPPTAESQPHTAYFIIRAAIHEDYNLAFTSPFVSSPSYYYLAGWLAGWL
jgi:hypothetical protein